MIVMPQSRARAVIETLAASINLKVLVCLSRYWSLWESTSKVDEEASCLIDELAMVTKESKRGIK